MSQHCNIVLCVSKDYTQRMTIVSAHIGRKRERRKRMRRQREEKTGKGNEEESNRRMEEIQHKGGEGKELKGLPAGEV